MPLAKPATVSTAREISRSGRLRTALLLGCAALALAGCGGAGLSTASLLPAAARPDAPQVPEDPLARPLQVAATSARAVKCGFYFDPQKLKASLLAHEARMVAADQLGKTEKTYDVAYRSVTEKLKGADDFCSENKTREIKVDLTRHLAGDFTPPARPKTAEDSLFSLPPSAAPKLDRERILDPGGPRPPERPS